MPLLGNFSLNNIEISLWISFTNWTEDGVPLWEHHIKEKRDTKGWLPRHLLFRSNSASMVWLPFDLPKQNYHGACNTVLWRRWWDASNQLRLRLGWCTKNMDTFHTDSETGNYYCSLLTLFKTQTIAYDEGTYRLYPTHLTWNLHRLVTECGSPVNIWKRRSDMILCRVSSMCLSLKTS